MFSQIPMGNSLKTRHFGGAWPFWTRLLVVNPRKRDQPASTIGLFTPMGWTRAMTRPTWCRRAAKSRTCASSWCVRKQIWNATRNTYGMNIYAFHVYNIFTCIYICVCAFVFICFLGHSRRHVFFLRGGICVQYVNVKSKPTHVPSRHAHIHVQTQAFFGIGHAQIHVCIYYPPTMTWFDAYASMYLGYMWTYMSVCKWMWGHVFNLKVSPRAAGSASCRGEFLLGHSLAWTSNHVFFTQALQGGAPDLMHSDWSWLGLIGPNGWNRIPSCHGRPWSSLETQTQTPNLALAISLCSCWAAHVPSLMKSWTLMIMNFD